MAEYAVQLAAAFVGALGYAVLFRVRTRLIFAASLGGVLSWLVYLLCAPRIDGTFFPALAASAAGALYAEILARVCKAPSTLFFVVAMMPLIPGRSLYYCMSYAVDGYPEIAGGYGAETFLCALGIGGGMALAWALCDLSRKIRAKYKSRAAESGA